MTTTNESTSSNPPLAKLVYGDIHVSTWENTDPNGKVYHSIRIERRYKDANGDWQPTNSYRVRDLPVVIDLIEQAQRELAEIKNAAVAV